MPRLLPLLVALALGVVPLRASASAVGAANISAELISETETIRPGRPFTVGIALRPAPGWHTYWLNPGDTGLPTRVDWKLPPGFRASGLEWPHPVRLGAAPWAANGYEGDALLLARIDAPEGLVPGSQAELVASARWLVCRDDACVPGKADLPLSIRVENDEPQRDSRWTEAFDSARARVPRRLEGWSAAMEADASRLRIRVRGPAAALPSSIRLHAFSVEPGVIPPSVDPMVEATADGLVVNVPRDPAKAAALPPRAGLVLVADEGWTADGSVRALLVDAVAAAGAPSPDAAATAALPGPAAGEAGRAGDGRAPDPAGRATAGDAAAGSAAPGGAATVSSGAALPRATVAPGADADVTLWFALLLAFAGGLVLNLMPCVFPVLSLKIVGFVHVAHHDAARVRRHGYAFTAGVLVSFWILAGALLALRAAGGALGWGFQLQEPLFVGFLAALLTAMALNLLGVFEFGSSLGTAAGRLDSHQGYRGSFLSGVVATVLATPCTAPFMGTAVGFALAQPAASALAVFTALGAGMAAPYLALSAAPSLLARLPRPGPWMELFRQAMAFPLLATVAWLAWVFDRQTGDDALLRLLAALVLGAFGAWIEGRRQQRAAVDGRASASAAAAVAAVLSAAVFLLVSASSMPPPAGAVGGARPRIDADGVEWSAWDTAGIDAHRREGRPVLVDFTADWCLSCKVNERVALSGGDFAELVRRHRIVAMRADWTRADPAITAALAAFGRSGVPLYVVYPADASREPLVLPQVLTPDLVREAIEKAAA